MNFFTRKIKSLQGIMYLSLLSLIVLTVGIIGLPMRNLTRNQVSTLALEQTNKVLDHLEQTLNLRMDRIKRLSDQLIMHDNLREFLSGNTLSMDEEKEARADIAERLDELERIYDDVVSIFAFGEPENDGLMKIVSSRENFILSEENPVVNQEWYRKAAEASGDSAITSPHLQNFIQHNYIWVVSFSRRILGAGADDVLGTLLIDINLDIIKDICTKNSTETHYYYIIDDSGHIVFHPHDQLIYSGLFTEPIEKVLKVGNGTYRIREGKDTRIYTIRTLYRTDWKIVAVTDVEELFNPFTPPLTFLLVWIGLSLILLLIASHFVAQRVLNPITSLRDTMKEVEEGQFDITANVSDYAEVGALARDFNIMIRRIGDLVELNEEEHRKLRISDFNALQSQINPHFLYNTLDSVIWMTAKGQSEEVITMVSSLSKLLRRSLATGDSLVPLEEEYDHARQYCTIQKIRYKDQLEFHLNLPENCRDIGVPRLILQPLIENALYHGVEDWEDGAQITISAIRRDGVLTVTVSDNGKGADPEELESHLQMDDETSPQSSVGLKNINDRLKILFGEKAGMSFRHQSFSGLDVILAIPLK